MKLYFLCFKDRFIAWVSTNPEDTEIDGVVVLATIEIDLEQITDGLQLVNLQMLDGELKKDAPQILLKKAHEKDDNGAIGRGVLFATFFNILKNLPSNEFPQENKKLQGNIDGISSHSWEGLKRARELHLEHMQRKEERKEESHPASADGFILSALDWAIKEMEDKQS